MLCTVSRFPPIWAETNLAVSTALDEIIDMTTENCYKINTVSENDNTLSEIEFLRKGRTFILCWTAYFFGVCVAGILIFSFFVKSCFVAIMLTWLISKLRRIS